MTEMVVTVGSAGVQSTGYYLNKIGVEENRHSSVQSEQECVFYRTLAVFAY